MAIRGISRAASRFGVRHPRVIIHGDDATPVDTPFHLQPITDPSGTLVEGDIWFGDTENAPKFYNGSAKRTVAALEGAQTFTDALTLSSTLNYKQEVVDTGGAFATPIVLTEAQSGRTILVDDAAGLDFTLPAVAAAQVGTFYKFLVTTTITSNSFRVTAASGDLLRGGIFMVDFDTANTGSYFTPDESNDLIFTANGSTTGGKKGTSVTFTAIHATGWFVEGLVFGDGVIATPFS